MNPTQTKPAPQLFLRKDHDDPDRFHLIERSWYSIYDKQFRPINYVTASFHGDSLASIFGERVAALAHDLDKGASLPLVISASCPDDPADIHPTLVDGGSTIISEAEACEVLSEQTIFQAAEAVAQ